MTDVNVSAAKRGRGRPAKPKPQIDEPKQTLGIYRTSFSVPLPSFGTLDSACFDLAMRSDGKISYKGYQETNAPFERQFNVEGSAYLSPGERVFLPTGLIFDIPQGYSVRVHSRSGMAMKQGLILVNGEGIIDSDYVQESFLLMINTGTNGLWIKNGDRLGQAELVKVLNYDFVDLQDTPSIKTDRDGGFGSTGV